MSSKSDSNSSSSLEDICEVERIIGKRISYGEVNFSEFLYFSRSLSISVDLSENLRNANRL